MNKKGINARLLESKMTLHGYNRKTFSEAVGVSPHTISNLLNGKYTPNYKLMNSIYSVLDLDPDEASEIFFTSDLRDTKE